MENDQAQTAGACGARPYAGGTYPPQRGGRLTTRSCESKALSRLGEGLAAVSYPAFFFIVFRRRALLQAPPPA